LPRRKTKSAKGERAWRKTTFKRWGGNGSHEKGPRDGEKIEAIGKTPGGKPG